MNDIPRPGQIAALGQASPDGLFFTYYFDAAGLRSDNPADAIWTWRSYHQPSLGARRAFSDHREMPPEAKLSFLDSNSDCHVDYDDGWLHGDLPDLRHDYSAEARGLGHFRFAFNERELVGARKQPLDSVERVRKLVDNRSRAFKSPADLVEAVTLQSLDGMATEAAALGDKLDGVEDRIVCDAWHSERQSLVDARRQLVAIHRQMATLTSLFRNLDQSSRAELPEQFADMVERLSNRTLSLHHDVEQLQARARLLQDELMTKLTEQSNRLLFTLSVMTAVLLPMTIITGLFGMNVGGIPFTHNAAGFWIVGALSIAVAIATLLFVRRAARGD